MCSNLLAVQHVFGSFHSSVQQENTISNQTEWEREARLGFFCNLYKANESSERKNKLKARKVIVHSAINTNVCQQDSTGLELKIGFTLVHAAHLQTNQSRQTKVPQTHKKLVYWRRFGKLSSGRVTKFGSEVSQNKSCCRNLWLRLKLMALEITSSHIYSNPVQHGWMAEQRYRRWRHFQPERTPHLAKDMEYKEQLLQTTKNILRVKSWTASEGQQGRARLLSEFSLNKRMTEVK